MHSEITMNRRSLIQSMGGATMLSAMAAGPAQGQPAARKTRLYRLWYMYLRQGDQGTRINQFLSSQMPLLTRHIHTVGVFNSLIAPHNPLIIVLSGFASFAEMEAADDLIHKDAGYQRAFEEMEKGAEPPYDTAQTVLLRATDFSPEIVPLREPPKTQRIFELRIYHSPTERQLRYLHERFAGPEIAIFHRSGVHPILYADTIIGPAMPNLTYLTPFATLAEREKAWDAFGADPEWTKARADSVARGGQIVAQNDISLLRAAPFSPIQ
ncbi:MAG TPA: NIPSNAP family protein [Bryobacteraceae bacterium]|nr:NIPSNAP family protein [Bryobacteraceae bacterium]